MDTLSTDGRYPPELRQQVIELARSGRTLRSLARELPPSEQTIRNWVRQANLVEGRLSREETTELCRELARLKRDNARLRTERDILRRATAWFADRSAP